MVYLKFKARGVAWKDQSTNPHNRGNPMLIPHLTELQGILRRFHGKPEFATLIQEFGYLKAPNDYKEYASRYRTIPTFSSSFSREPHTPNVAVGLVKEPEPEDTPEDDYIEFYIGVDVKPLCLRMTAQSTKDSSERDIRLKHLHMIKKNITKFKHIYTVYAGNKKFTIVDSEVLPKRPTITDPVSLSLNLTQNIKMATIFTKAGVADDSKWTKTTMRKGVCKYDNQLLKELHPHYFDYKFNKSSTKKYREQNV